MKKLIATLLCISLLCACTQETIPTESMEIPEPIVQAETLEPTLSIYKEDANYLIQRVEGGHACFVLNDVPEGYEAAKAEYLETAKICTDDRTFHLATCRYVASLQDGHSSVGLKGLVSRVLDLNCIWFDNAQWMLDENGLTNGTKVISIGSIPVEDIFAVVKDLCAMENEGAAILLQNQFNFDGILQEAGVDVSSDTLEVVFETDGQQRIEQIPLISVQDYQAKITSPCTARYEMLDDVFYVDFNDCVINEELIHTADALKEAVDNGVTKVIIDVRGNTGGNSEAGERLFHAMGMEVPRYTRYIRTDGTELLRVEDMTNSSSYQGAVQNPNIQLIILSDEVTFSSAKMLCVWVQDGDLGLLIGRPSSNHASSYGVGPNVNLPNTNLNVSISSMYFERPDKEASQTTMEMDVYVPHDQDILSVALELLA